MNDCYLSFDTGGSKYIVGLIDRSGEVLGTRRGVWNELTPACILETLITEARALLAQTQLHPVACGVTIPGLADPEKGLWVEASFSGIRNFAICEAISEALSLPAYCDNDGQAFALAEMVFGACRDVQDFLYVNVSNGIGGAVVSGGKLVYGARGNAGEFGHCIVVPGGRPCKCGSYGCLEMYAAGPGIARTYQEAGGAPETDGKPAQGKRMAERARGGEKLAQRIFEQQGEMIGSVVATAVNILNPRKVILGGGLALAYDCFGPALEKTVNERIYNNANPDLTIQPTKLGYLAGLYGGAAIAVTRTESLLHQP